MGIQSFKFPVDFLNNLEKPIIYIANKHKEILASVAVYDDLSLTCNLNAYQTASFKIYQYVDGVKQDYFKLFEEEMLIMIPGISWYEIHVETNIEPTGISKSITANSLECRLCDKRLVDFECNTGEILYDDYVKTIFCDFTNPKGSLLHRVLNYAPNWSVGHVDKSLMNKQRSFDVDDTDIYSFLTGEVSEAFNCLFTFDTFNQTVNAYDLDNYGLDTNIFVSMDNLAQNMTQTIDENSIFTCYRVNGGDGIYINNINPNGTNKIYNFEYYLPQMPQEIQKKINSYNELFQNLKPKYEAIMLKMKDELDTIQELKTRVAKEVNSKDWTKYGLIKLQSFKKSFESNNQALCASGYNRPSDIHYNMYKENLKDLDDVTYELNIRQSEIDTENEKYERLDSDRKSLQEKLDMDNFFTVEEWKAIDNYVVEETYTNDNFILTDLDDNAERFNKAQQLYDKAWKDLSKKCRPQYQYSATLSNVLTIPEFKDFIPYFELGNFIRMETDYDTVIKLRLISFTVNYSNTQTINVTFSDAIRVKDVYEDSASIQAQANSAAMSFQFNKDQYDKSVREGNFVSEMRKYGLDVATTNIHNSSNQSQIWDSTGMTFRQWNEQKQDYDPEMAKIINNMMVFSDDGMKTVRMGIGKIFLPNGESSYGINGETILGKLYLGEYLTLQNDSGTYKFDDSGFSATNGKNTIKIQPNKSEELFSIYKQNNKKFYIDSDGNLHFEGDLTGATGTFSGELKSGTINIGNGTFTVDKDGHMIASSGTFGGNLQSATGTFSGELKSGSINIGNGTFVVDSSGRITANVGRFGGLVSGGSININNNFTVDKYGNMIALSGTFGGLVSGGSININDNFTVDKYGNMIAKSGKFSGDIIGGSININNNFTVDKYGNMIAKSGNIAGWKIEYYNNKSYKLYGGDENTGVAAMQAPGDNMLYVFAAGGRNHNNYGDCPFRVTKYGALYAKKGKISEFNITDKGLEWDNYGTKIWANTLQTSYITATASSTGLDIGEKTKTTYIYGKKVYVNDNEVTTNAHLEKRIDDLQKWVRNNFKTK